MYLPFWQQSWNKIKEDKQHVLKSLGRIPDHARTMTGALVKRQREMAEATGAEIIEATSTSPFATGLGWEHPNENGFAFLNPYGLPYLAASGVKGVLRDAACELARSPAGDAHGWTEDAVTALFGPMPEEIKKPEDATGGALRFFDVIPEIAGKGLDVDIMNPHYGEYYQGNSTPHDAGTPVPIFFLVVPADSKFTFVVDCPRERYLPEDLRKNWRVLTKAAFGHAFEWLGFGAKTAVGYGAMTIEPKRPSGSGHAAAAPVSVSQNETWLKAELKWEKGKQELTAVNKEKKIGAFSESGKGKSLFDQLPEDARKQLANGKDVQVDIEVAPAGGGRWKIVAVKGH
jgi:CRISPR-associated protein Cmr6